MNPHTTLTMLEYYGHSGLIIRCTHRVHRYPAAKLYTPGAGCTLNSKHCTHMQNLVFTGVTLSEILMFKYKWKTHVKIHHVCTMYHYITCNKS